MKKIFTLLSLVLVTCFNVKGQYCLPTYNSYCCTSFDYIDDFYTTGGTSNITNMGSGGCTTPYTTAPYHNYTFYNGMIVSASPGGTFTVNMQAGTVPFAFSQSFRVWIDWNNDGAFTAGESVFSATSSTTLQTGTVTVPAGVSGLLRMRVMCRYNTPTLATDFCATAMSFGETEDYLVNITSVPCTGKPEAGNIASPAVVTLCPTNTYQLIDTGFTTGVYAINYIWQKSINGGTSWSSIAGATTSAYTIPAGTPSAMYRMLALCTTSFQFDTSNVITVNLTPPSYAALPYVQSFENWTNSCDNKDLPDVYWTNLPSKGNKSWRKNNEGTTGNWVYPTSGVYNPLSTDGNYSARFHSYQANGSGALSLYIDLSTAAGNKQLLFDDNIDFGTTLQVDLSTNGGTSFSSIGNFISNLGDWRADTITIPSNSPTCIIRFTSTTSSTFIQDLGLDNVRVLPPCGGTPNSGTIHDTTVCASTTTDTFRFNLTVDNATIAAGITYTWQSSPNAGGPWTVIGNSIVPKFSTYVTGPTYFQCVVSCINSGQSSTTPAHLINNNLWYYCYCNTSLSNSGFDNFDIGNVYICKTTGTPVDTIVFNAPIAASDTQNNANATNTYTSFQNIAPVKKLYLDSTYKTSIVNISQFLNAFGASRIFIDYNQDGSYNTSTEAVTGNGISNNITTGAFTVPHAAKIGITGMRVISSSSSAPGSIQPCSGYAYGETEDYLVEIIQANCVSPLNPGSVYQSDNQICAGYEVVLIDTSHTSGNAYAGLTFNWQQSANGTTGWTNIAGAVNDTFLAAVTANTYYRFSVRCINGDSAFSPSVFVTLLPSQTCYPASGAQWGKYDSTDNGSFRIGQYLFTGGGGGPHIGNPYATRARTNFTTNIDLYSDSLYKISFYSIIKPYAHADARVTMFIDYNNDAIFNIPNERVFIGTANAANFYLTGAFRTPKTGIALNTPTGLRIIVNNNSGPNPQSDQGVGIYTSGETEDYIVTFKKAPLAINTIANLSNLNVYPNPTSGIVYIDADINTSSDVNIAVVSVTGQTVYSNTLKNVSNKLSTSINLEKMAKGIYTVKIQTKEGTAVQLLTIE